ncbi:MAG: hypothetical protein J6W19_11520, partial [Prevotella sp.]|nr:hypothetical protein [Prevotella sp.]
AVIAGLPCYSALKMPIKQHKVGKSAFLHFCICNIKGGFLLCFAQGGLIRIVLSMGKAVLDPFHYASVSFVAERFP